ncbi:MAG: hypothetical protein ACI976_000070 [Aureispira sp.]|jgi:hypothetical protein
MIEINWDKLAEKAYKQTNAELNVQIASLTSLKVSEIDAFIEQSTITNANAVKVLQEINNAASSNNQKAEAIANIDKGSNFLISIISKLI